MNEQEKKRLTNQTLLIKKKLEEHFQLKVVQDFLSKDEKDELGDSYNYFIIEEDGFDAPMSENAK